MIAETRHIASTLAPRRSRIRVARVIDRLNIGGPSKHVVWLAACLDPDTFETVLITGSLPAGEGDMSYFARAAGVEPVVIDEMSRTIALRDVVVVFKLLREFFRIRPHIIHTHKAKAGAVGRTAAMIYRWLTPSALWLQPRQCRIVHTYHGHVLHSYYGALTTKIFVAIERMLARMCTDRVITVSEQQRQDILERFRIGRPDQVRVIPLGIDINEVVEGRGRLRSELGIGDAEWLVGIVGRLCEVKNHALLLEAAARLTREGVRARFVVVGDGHLRPQLQGQTCRLGIIDVVTFSGFRRDLLRLYGDFDIVALTSLNEGTPVTLIEAMACGRPVAATEVGGVVDIMGVRHWSCDGFTVWDHGVTVPSRNAEAFCRALRFLLEHPDLRRDMGERGRVFVRSHMGKDRLIRDVEQLYAELVSWRAQPRERSYPPLGYSNERVAG